MQDKEIEIQVRIERSEPLKNFLEKEANFISENRQVDEYFTPAHKNFIEVKPIEEWLRIRDEKGKFTINYKKWIYENGVGIYADEYETAIGDRETGRKIFMALDFKPLIVVDKTRRKYIYKDYEVAFDRVVGLGDFVEVEYKGEAIIDPKEETKKMIQFLKNQDCGKIEINHRGYPMSLLFPKDITYIQIK